MPRKSKLALQCEELGWPLHIVFAMHTASKMWNYAGHGHLKPEEVINLHLADGGKHCCWCEGASLKILIKAATLDALEKFNKFSSRQDAIRRYLEAQMTILATSQTEILGKILETPARKLLDNISEICSDSYVKALHPTIRCSFIKQLSQSISRTMLFDIASIFFKKPYDFRSGWPDLTIIDDSKVAFVEVKTTDLLHNSQLRFAQMIANPLGLDCSIYQLKRLPNTTGN